jgi:uncharacterized protein YdhG (YjbR/CyaY superfamily)
MTKASVPSVTSYIAGQPLSARAVLTRVRGIIRRAIPGAKEVISYKIPAYKRDGRAVLYFAGWKEHYSLYPVSASLLAALGVPAGTYEIRNSTIRFPLDKPVPATLIARIAKARAAEGKKKGSRAKA